MVFWGWDWGWGGLWAFFGFFVVFAILIVPWLFFLLNLRGLLESVSVPNRAMPPEQVWLNFIPIFNFYWFIHTVAKVRDSVKAEYYGRGWPIESDFGYNVGLAAGILGICSVVFGWIPVIGGVSIAALICWIIYWLKMADLKHRLSFSAWQGPGSPPPYADYQPPYGQAPGQGPGMYPPYQQPATGAAGQWQRPPGAQASSAPKPPEPQQPGAVAPPAPKRTTDKQCAVCDTTVAPDDKFCRGCGLPLP